jgi:hypothetical protein
MSTRAQDFRAAAEREPKKKAKAVKPSLMKKRGTHTNKRAGKKAVVSQEANAAPTKKRPSRKSTRAAKNRGRQDEGLVVRQEGRARSADTRARNAKAKTQHPRGKPRG